MGIRQSFEPSTDSMLSAVTRFDAGAILSKLDAAGLLAQGRVHIVSLDAIRIAFGPRWDERKVLVWDMAETQILKRIGPQDFAARLSEVDFAVITPKLEQAAAQILAARLSCEILRHFLGDTRTESISIKIVTAFADQQIFCNQIADQDLQIALASCEQEAGAVAISRVSPTNGNDPLFLAGAGAVTTASGLKLRFSTSIAPIIDLNQWAVAGHRVEPKITYEDSRIVLSPEARRQLLPRDLEAIDAATLKKGLQRLASGDRGAGESDADLDCLVSDGVEHQGPECAFGNRLRSPSRDGDVGNLGK